MVSTLDIVIAQRLVRRLTKAKEEYTLSKAELESLGKHVDLARILESLKAEKVIEKDVSWEKVPFFKPKKSNESEDGYSGRIGIYETLVVSEAIKGLIMRGATADDVEAQAKKEGMIAMIEDGIFKAVQGQTTIEEVLRVISE